MTVPHRGDQELWERESELAAIDRMVSVAAAGEPCLLVLEGAAGIGKTRLVGEARRRAAAAGIPALVGRGSELERDFAFGVVRQLFEAAALAPGAPVELLEGAAAAARPIFTSLPEAADSQEDASFAALHGLYWLTLNLAGDDPLMLVVDDLHWCDRPSLRFLAYLIKRLDGLPVSVVTSLRPAEPGVDAALLAEVTSDPLALSLRPAGLSGGAITELIADRLGAVPDGAFADACHRATGGNPLLVNELLKAMRSEGVTPDAAHVAAVRDLGPRAASRSVLLRLSRLPTAVIAVARAVAVLGEGADIDVVAALCGIDHAAAVNAAAELARAEILRPDRPLGFVHPLVRAAVYNDLPPAEREAIHGRAARLLAAAGASSDQVASQLLPTPGGGDPWVVETLVEAARVALGRGAPDGAVTYLARALAEPPSQERRPHVLLQLGVTESMSHGPGSVEHLRAAYETLGDPVGRARAAAVLAPVYFFLGQESEGAALAERAMEGLGPEHADLRRQLEVCLLMFPLYEPARDADVGLLSKYRTEPLGPDVGSRLLAGMTAYHWAMTGGPRDACVALARHAVGDGVLAAHANGAVPYVGAQIVLAMADAPDALDAVTEAYEAAHRSGALLAITPTRIFRGMLLAHQGELEEAEQLVRGGLQENDAWGFVSVRLFPGSLLAGVLVERGDLAGAREALEHANPGLSALPSNSNAAFWFDSHLRHLVATGAWAQAIEVAQECEERFSRLVVNPTWIPWRSLQAQALDRLGRTDEAVALATAELALAEDWGAPRARSQAMRTLGMLLREDGLPYLEQAVAVTAGTTARLEHAKALADLGTVLRLARRPTEAREPLQRALDMAALFGAAPLEQRVRAELQATGVRPRTEALSGVGALTASERRVADAAARGQTNKDIAQALYVTPKTVEVHLSNAYRKLGIRSRRELVGALVTAG